MIARATNLVSGALLAALMVVPAGAADRLTPVETAIDRAIRPGFERLATTTTDLHKAVAIFCAAPNPGNRATVDADFAAATSTWSTIEFVRLGPLETDNLAERILFWPDRKSIGIRQVQAALTRADDAVLDPTQLAGKSVALQGFGALEYLLYGTGSDSLAETGGDRCRFAETVAGLLAERAGEADRAWAETGGIVAALLDPHPEAPRFRSPDDSLKALLNTLAHGLEALRDTRLSPMRGAAIDKARPKQAPFWRSEMTVVALRANFAGLADLFAMSGLADLLPADRAFIAQSIRFEFANAENALAPLANQPALSLAIAPDNRRRLDYAILVANSLHTLISDQLASALGLRVGFSSLDGD